MITYDSLIHDQVRIDSDWRTALRSPGERSGLYCYSAIAFPTGAPPVEGMMVILTSGPGVAFIPFTAIRGDESPQQIRDMIAANIPEYTHPGTWKATAEEKARALAILAALGGAR